MNVIIGFSTSDGWVSRTIRWFTKATVSHTFILLQDPISPFNHEVYEAAWCGFRMSTLPRLQAEGSRVVNLVAVNLDFPSALGICRSWLETPYDYLGLLGEAWVQLGRLFGRRWRNPSAGPHHLFCSEAACRLLQALKFPAVVGLDARATSPEDLLEVLTHGR